MNQSNTEPVTPHNGTDVDSCNILPLKFRNPCGSEDVVKKGALKEHLIRANCCKKQFENNGCEKYYTGFGHD